MLFRITLIAVCFTVSLFSIAHAREGGIPIYSCEELRDISLLEENYYLNNDLECANTVFYPILNSFRGTLDGGIYDANGNYTGENYTISNLTIQYVNDEDGGLFTELYTATFKNIHFQNATVYGDITQAWGLVAGKAFYSHILNITAENIKMDGPDDSIGAGEQGGIIGYSQGTNLAHVHVRNVTIKQRRNAGGLVGEQGFRGEIRDSSVTGLQSSGGCFQDDQACSYGGIIGLVSRADEDWVVIRRSYAEGSINSQFNAGGLIGFIAANSHVHIEHSYSKVSLSSSKFAGGLIGQAPQEGNNEKGNVKLNHVFAIGPVHVDGKDAGRGILGNYSKSSNRVIATESYFDKQETGKKYSGDSGSKGLSSLSMRDQSETTFSATDGWDRNIWHIENGFYPSLKM